MITDAVEQARRFARYAVGLRAFFADTLTEDECRARLAALPRAEDAFLDLLRDDVFAYGPSPYRALFEWAGITLSDVGDLVGRLGLEATLHQLFDAGIFVTVDEFHGRRPIERPGLRLEMATAPDFDNPRLQTAYVARSGGSRAGAGRRR